MSLAMLLAALLLPSGCGGDGLEREVAQLLARRSGEIDSVAYACITEDAGLIYREVFELRFPDEYRYSFYELGGGQGRLVNHATQKGSDVYRARIMRAGGGGTDSLRVESLSHVPPIRCTGAYMSLYHLVGNVDYFQSVISLLEGGELRVTGTEDLEGTATYRLESASGLTPGMRIWLDAETGLPVRKELDLSEGRVVVFRYEDVVENADYGEASFPPDITSMFGGLAAEAEPAQRDGACRHIDIGSALAEAGFQPLLPRLDGFELAGAFVREPAASNLSASEESARFPAGFRELYLVLRDGSRQVEIRQSPYDPEFSYYTTGLGSLAGAYLTHREVLGEEAGGAAYTAALDCQEMRLTLDDVEIMVTGDLSREEFEALAVQLREMSLSSP